MRLKPVTTEKAVMMIEKDNVITFQTEKISNKEGLKKEVEEMFDVKVEKVRTLVKGSKKYAYVKLKKEFLAIDIATKLGMM